MLLVTFSSYLSTTSSPTLHARREQILRAFACSQKNIVQGEFVKHGVRMLCASGAVYLQSNVQEVACYTHDCFSRALSNSALSRHWHDYTDVSSRGGCMEAASAGGRCTGEDPTSQLPAAHGACFASSAEVLSNLQPFSRYMYDTSSIESETECISRLRGRQVFRWCLVTDT